MALLVVGVEILVIVGAWALGRSYAFEPSLGGNNLQPNDLLIVPVLLCLVVAAIAVQAYRRGNGTRSLYLFVLVVAGVAMLGGTVLARTRPDAVCKICVSGCAEGVDLFGPDFDGPSKYSTRACSKVRETGYENLSSDREKFDAWVDRGTRVPIVTVVVGSLAALIAVVLWFLDRRRGSAAPSV